LDEGRKFVQDFGRSEVVKPNPKKNIGGLRGVVSKKKCEAQAQSRRRLEMLSRGRPVVPPASSQSKKLKNSQTFCQASMRGKVKEEGGKGKNAHH